MSDSGRSPDEVAAAAPTPPRGRSFRAWRNAVFAIFFLAGFGLAAWLARLPAIRDDVAVTLDEIGLMILAMSIGSVVGLLVAEWMLVRFGARSGMVTSLMFVSVGLAGMGVGSTILGSVVVLTIGMISFGFGLGSLDVMMNVEGAAAERVHEKTLLPLMHAFFSMGMGFSAVIGALASAVEVPVFWHLAVVALIVFGCGLLAIRFVPALESVGDRVEPAVPRPPFAVRLRYQLSVWADARLLLIGVVMLGMAFAEGAAGDWLALAVVDGHGLDNTVGALVLGLFVASMTVMRVIGGPLLDRFGRVVVLRVCAGVGIVGLTMFIFGTNAWVLVVGTVLWGLGCALGFPVGMSAAADHPTRSAARVSAVAVIGYGAFLVGPPLLGFLGEQFGVLNALLVILGLMVLAGLAAPAARERPGRGPRRRAHSSR